jgi:ribosomal protein S6
MAGALDSGYFVNFIFNADPALVAKLRTKFKLDPEVYRQSYQRLPEKKDKPAKKVAKSK